MPQAYAFVLSLLVSLPLLGAVEATGFAEGFEDATRLTQATILGEVAASPADPYKGQASLRLARTKADMDRQPTSATLPSFPVREGLWDLSAAMRSRLFSPDSSYNGSVFLETADAAGKMLERIEVAISAGDRPWRSTRRRIELSSEAITARFVVRMEKTHGEFAVDELAATFAGESLRTVAAITFASEAVGNLFLPEQPLRFTVTAICTKPRAPAERVVTCVVRDYWGSEHTAPLTIALTEAGTTTRKRLTYSGTLDLGSQHLEAGRYFELHAEMGEPVLPEPARDTSSFAVLPLAVTKRYPPFAIPFTASGWNPGVPGFYPLCDRLGLRVTNVYSRWSAQPPYEITAPGIETVKELGMGALLGTPVGAVESRRKGYEAFDATALREGAKRLIETYKNQLPIALRVGNEPHVTDDADAQRMIAAYQAVYEGAKAADPSVIVVATSCGPDQLLFRNGYQKWHDVYDFHQYSGAETVPADFARYERLVAKHGMRKPVWTTEIGLNSQGMARSAVASQMVKIFANFFACGGANLSWFGIMWPDPDGRIVGSNGDSFDVFNSKYSLYSPKMTAISEYNLVNAICIKRAVAQKAYPGGVVLTLMRDVENRCLLVAWKEGGAKAVTIPLPGVEPVRAIRLDGGTSQLDAHGQGLTLGLSDEPYLLEFTSGDVQLPADLGEPSAFVDGPAASIVKGGAVRISLRCAGADPTAIALTAPPRWTVQREVANEGSAAFVLTAPQTTAAREGRVLVRLGGGSGEIQVPVAVVDPLEVVFLPVPASADRPAGMGLRLTNRGLSPQQVAWKVTMPETYAMANGTFKLGEPDPFAPTFTAANEGRSTLEPGASAEVAVRASNLDPLSLYRARLDLNADGVVISQERLFGGAVGVPRVNGGVVFDGKLGDPAWRTAAMVQLVQPGQFAPINRKTASWDGVADLSATMRLLWDESYLYIGMTVRDDVFRNPERDSAIWRGDGLQFLVDPCRASTTKPGRYDYAIAQTAQGPQAWCYTSVDTAQAPAEEVKEFLIRITPTGEAGGMIYEVAIPWKRFAPFVPALGADLGLAMIVNEDDGKGRDSFMSWFGCAHTKQMSMNGDLLLIDAR